MSVCDTAQRFPVRPGSGAPKRSSNVALALMGTASFVATFAAGSMALNWASPSRPVAATAQQACTKNPDGTQGCPRSGSSYNSSSGWRSYVHYYIPWSSSSNSWGTTFWGSSSSAKLSDTGTAARRVDGAVVAKRSGFGSFAHSFGSAGG